MLQASIYLTLILIYRRLCSASYVAKWLAMLQQITFENSEIYLSILKFIGYLEVHLIASYLSTAKHCVGTALLIIMCARMCASQCFV